MKILITGSHFTPAQAVIKELQKQKENKVVYLGRKYTQEGDRSLSVESQVLPKLGVKFIPLVSGRLQRTLTVYTILSLFKIPFGMIQAFYYILKEKPDVVLSFGGYIAVPVVISAWLFSIPVIIHEQTLISGLANTISSWFANKVAVSFESNKNFSENKTIVTGNPIREEILTNKKESGSKNIKNIIQMAKSKKLPLLLVTGGNQGSHVINEAVGDKLEGFLENFCIIHQTGDSKFNDFEKLLTQKNNLKNSDRYLVEKWFDVSDFAAIFQNIDLAISRGGINILQELSYFKIPTLVIPIPYLYKNEQTVNAKFFEKVGLVTILPQKELSGENLLKNIQNLVKGKRNLQFKSIVIPDAAKRLALETMLLGLNNG